MASRDSVAKKEEGKKTAEKLYPSSTPSTRNTGSRDTVASRSEGSRTAAKVYPSASLASGSSGSRDTVAQRAAGARAAARSYPSASLTSGSTSRSTAQAPVSQRPPTSLAGGQSTVPLSRLEELSQQVGANVAQPNIMAPGAIDRVIGELMLDPRRAAPVTAGVSMGGLDTAFGGWLEDQNDYRQAKIAEREAAGVAPSEGPINWNAILYDLNAPMRERGVQFEGPVDWGGIGNAISGAFGGIGEALNGPMPAAAPARRGIPTNFGGFVEREPGLGSIDPETGFVKDPVTGTWYRPDYAPQADRLAETSIPEAAPPAAVAANPLQVINDAAESFGALGNLAEGIAAEGERLSQPPVQQDPYYEQPPMPPSTSAPKPELISDPDQMVWEPAVVEAAPGAATDRSAWETVTDVGGKVFENTLLGGAIKTFFPEFWNESGDAIRNMGTGGTLPNSLYPPDSLVKSEGSSGSGNGLQGFIDLNGNGIDDRLEGYTPPPPGGTPQQPAAPIINYTEAFFPDIPPYNPGVSPEWKYFRPKSYAYGGPVYADGGIVAAAAESQNGASPLSGLDPRITIIADAEDALEGEHPNPEEAIAVFVEAFGPDALEMLKAQVRSGMTLRGHQRKSPRMAKSRFVEGPGGPKDDQVPARIDDVEEARLSDGEFVVEAGAVRGAGEGDPVKGAAKLSELAAMLAGRDGDDELMVERVS